MTGVLRKLAQCVLVLTLVACAVPAASRAGGARFRAVFPRTATVGEPVHVSVGVRSVARSTMLLLEEPRGHAWTPVFGARVGRSQLVVLTLASPGPVGWLSVRVEAKHGAHRVWRSVVARIAIHGKSSAASPESVTCAAGQTGTPPTCHPTNGEVCPTGQIGTPPNCHPIAGAVCAAGQIGTPPTCYQPPSAVCLAGQTGRPPNCHVPPPSPNRGATLAAGQTLTGGQHLESSDGHYELVMQGDGNFVEYVGGRALWSTGTSGNPGAYVAMQSTDGNLVVYSASNHPLWASSTSGAGAYLALQPDANVVVYSPANASLWSSGSINSTLQPGETLAGSQSQSLRSADGHYIFVMQADGDLVLYGTSGALWSSGTVGNPGAWVGMQGDGNLVVYSPSNQALWSSGTAGNGGDHLGVQTDGNVVIYSAGAQALWATNTVPGSSPPGEGQGQAIVSAAASQVGLPYCFGGGDEHEPTHKWGNIEGATQCGPQSTVGFDCTGLTQYAAYQGTGGAVDLTHHNFEQAKYAPGQWITSEAALLPGDIVYFGYSRNDITHAAVYAGVVNGQQMIWDADTVWPSFPIYRDGVQERQLRYENSQGFVGAARVWH